MSHAYCDETLLRAIAEPRVFTPGPKPPIELRTTFRFGPALRRWGFLVLMVTTWVLLFTPSARAAYLDNVEVQASGGDVLIRVHFNIRVQYLRHVPEKQGDVLQIFLRQQSGEVPPPVTEESKTVADSDLLPRFSVTYPLQNGAPTKRLLVKFEGPVRYRVSQGIDTHSVEILVQPVLVSKPKKPTTPARYAIFLDTYSSVDQARTAPVPPELSRYETFLSKSDIADMELYDRNVGYFDTAAAAEVIRERIANKFPQARVVDTSTHEPVGKEVQKPAVAVAPPAKPKPTVATPPSKAPPPMAEPAIVVPPKSTTAEKAPVLPVPVTPPASIATAPVTPAPVAPGAAKPAPAAATGATPDVERQALQYMESARNAFASGKWEEAIDVLNKLLVLPPNSQTQQAQEMIGIARERGGQLAKAKAEYELYLKLYPDAEGVPRVKERLVAIDRSIAEKPASAMRSVGAPAEGKEPVKSVFGSFAQYYYEGSTKSDTAFNTPTTVDQATLTSRDLSAIVTTADLNARYRSDTSDVRLVFRDTDSVSLIDRNPSRNRLDAAYVDYRGIGMQNPMSLRVGRQIGTSGGILGRFDGAIAGYKVTKNWRVNVDVGQPVDYGLDSKRYFYGLSLDAENIFDYWSGNVYVIKQMVDGIPDREAVGGELRYFKNGNSLYSMVDYDTLFNKWNIATIQGSVQTAGMTTFTILADQRKAPPLATTNAVFGQPVSSVKALLATNTEEQLRLQALSITADVKQFLASVTTPLSAAWQLGFDYRLTNVGPLPAYNDIPATPGTGNIYGYTLQTIGSNLYSSRDINVFSASYLKSQNFDGEYFSYSNLSGLGAKWTVEPSVRWYTQNDNTDTKTNRYTGILRLTYAWKENLYFDGEYDIERSVVDSPLQRETALHQFFYIGYRYTF